MDKCIYPNWEGGFIKEEHSFDRDGYCNICGKKKEFIAGEDLKLGQLVRIDYKTGKVYAIHE